MTTRVGVLAIVLLLSGVAHAALNADNDADHVNASPDAAGNATSTCTTVTRDLTPCMKYIQGKDAKPPANCCKGAMTLSEQAKTKAERQAMCECIKKDLALIGKYDQSRIPLLVKDCKLSIKLPPISKNTDCKK
ncbi:putative non-specific lipid-transfer protein 1 [Morella rubra]|uniref:Non-specific lipid-transfer protein n=1 Tax=Morella rubra TaxID=262757 RepID=A0A6A1W9W7_9ROSI|nr:putative non-specific lipid-transfer protein 1 [Morella rubra]